MWILQLRRFFGNGQTVALSVIPHLWAMPLGVYGHMWTQIWAASYSVGRVPSFGWHRTQLDLRSKYFTRKVSKKSPRFFESLAPLLRLAAKEKTQNGWQCSPGYAGIPQASCRPSSRPEFYGDPMGRSAEWLKPEIDEAWGVMGVMGIYHVYIYIYIIYIIYILYIYILYYTYIIYIIYIIYILYMVYHHLQMTCSVFEHRNWEDDPHWHSQSRRGAVRSCTWRAAIPLSRAWGRREWAPQLSGWKWQQFSGRVLKQWDFEVSLFGQSHSSPWYHTNVHCRNRKWFKNMVTHQVDME